MNFQQLEYIIALDKYKSFVKAAEKCFITQPTITMQVKKLEEELGFKIFNRQNKPLSSTTKGKKVIELANIIISRTDQIKNITEDEVYSKISIGIIPTISSYLSDKIIKHFTSNYKSIKFYFKEIETSSIIEQLKKNKLDFGILSTPINDKYINSIKLYDESFKLYSTYKKKTTLVSVDDIDYNKLIIIGEGHCMRNQIIKICQNNYKNDPKKLYQIDFNNINSITKLVFKGLGETLVPKNCIDETFIKEHLYDFKNPKPYREVSLVYNEIYDSNKTINFVYNELKKICPKEHEIKGKRIAPY